MLHLRICFSYILDIYGVNVGKWSIWDCQLGTQVFFGNICCHFSKGTRLPKDLEPRIPSGSILQWCSKWVFMVRCSTSVFRMFLSDIWYISGWFFTWYVWYMMFFFFSDQHLGFFAGDMMMTSLAAMMMMFRCNVERSRVKLSLGWLVIFFIAMVCGQIITNDYSYTPFQWDYQYHITIIIIIIPVSYLSTWLPYHHCHYNNPKWLVFFCLYVSLPNHTWDSEIPSGNLLHSFWKCPFMVSFPMKNRAFP